METSTKFKKNIIGKLLIFIITLFSLVLITIQDLAFSKYGEVFRTPFSVIIFFFFFSFILFLFKRNNFSFSRIEKLFIVYLIYLIIISWFNIFIFILNRNIYLLGKNIILKGTIVLIYYTLFISAIIFFRLIFQKLSYLISFYLFSFINIFLFFIFIIELKTKPYFSFLHNDIPYYRIRLLTHESSWAGALVLVFYFFNLYFYFKSKYDKKSLNTLTNKFLMAFVTIFFILFLIYSGSKGLYMSLTGGLLISFFLYLKRTIKHIYKKLAIKKIFLHILLLIVIIGLFFYMLIIPKLLKSLLDDIENYTSFSTRSILIYSAVKMFIFNPLGYGTSIFYPKLLETVNETINNLSNNFLLNLRELMIYFNTYKGLSIKSFFFQNLAIGGILFLVIFFLIIKEGLNIIIRTNYLLLWLYVTIIISLIVYMNADIKYQYAAFFGLISVEVLKNEKKHSNFRS